MGGQHGERLPRERHRRRLRGVGLRRGEDAAFPSPVEDAVARVRAGVSEAIGTARFRRLRQRDEKRGLAEGQALRLTTEIGQARRAQALQIAAIGRQHEIEAQDLILREALLQLQARTI